MHDAAPSPVSCYDTGGHVPQASQRTTRLPHQARCWLSWPPIRQEEAPAHLRADCQLLGPAARAYVAGLMLTRCVGAPHPASRCQAGTGGWWSRSHSIYQAYPSVWHTSLFPLAHSLPIRHSPPSYKEVNILADNPSSTLMDTDAARTQSSLPCLFDGDDMLFRTASAEVGSDLEHLLCGLLEDGPVQPPTQLFPTDIELPQHHLKLEGSGEQGTTHAAFSTITTGLGMLPAVQSSALGGSSMAVTHTGTLSQAGEEDHDDSCAEQEMKPAGKGRRRRIRNAKQQELNRLAQQRYRQRKKQKAADLSHQVDTLSCQLEQLRAKDAELAEIKKMQAELTQRVLEQQLVIQQAHEQLVAKDRTIAQQAGQLAELKAQLQQQQQGATQAGVVAVPTTTNAAAALAASLDPAKLSEQLAGMLLEALVELGVQLSVPTSMLHAVLQQRLVQQLAICTAGLKCATPTPTNTIAQGNGGKSRAPITVSCC